MESIALTLNYPRLNAVCDTMKVVQYAPTSDKRVRSDRAIFSEVRQKLFKKLIGKEGATKDFKLKLTYYEAYQLEDWLREWLHEQAASLEVTLVRMVADELNQKLA